MFVQWIATKPAGAEERPWREDIEELVRWYDHWLKGNDTGMLDEAPVRLFVAGANKWREEKEWPLPGTKHVAFYLNRWEGLSPEPELYMNEPDCFLQQPLHVSSKRDQVEYVSPPLPDDMECIGPVGIKFYASIDQDDTNWIVDIFDVNEGGAQMGMGRGYLKASHRKTDPRRSKIAEPYRQHLDAEPVKPNEIYEYEMSLGIMSNVIKAGHRIKLVIRSMESPRDPEMQIHYHHHLCSAKTTLHRIYRDREHRSVLLLPIAPKSQG